MDENMLMQVVKSNLPIVSTAIQSLIAALITTIFLKANTNTKEITKLKSAKFGEVINDLLKSGKMTYLEFYKCKNFLRVAEIADEKMKNSNHKIEGENEFNFDWFMRFFDAVGNISNEDLQKLWGQVLASEIVRPTTCSLRTLDMIRNLSPNEAKTFNILCNHIMISGDTHCIYSTGFGDEFDTDGSSACREYIAKKKLNYSKDIIPMFEIGLMTADHSLAINLKPKEKLTIHNDKILCIVECKNEKVVFFEQKAYFLTASGIELYNIIKETPDYDADIEYAILCFKNMKKNYTDLEFYTFKMLESNSDESHYDFFDLSND
ncbi:DUF2806 domain-containing protein [Proteiniborus sp. MB09-C3]|uniref:DUF2806 domain-containing protein n=1 Tax=Proteiniborus sp. MB09-C3 TaxID=3050072 RepID=UPI002554C3BB|nr:DUF2806 domain-containing protein [Proteiniborus sp. MB09-C3]WIV11135.1 DUF2806 domain-containing protein [Proteiniborus sp. MB09-C3]